MKNYYVFLLLIILFTNCQKDNLNDYSESDPIDFKNNTLKNIDVKVIDFNEVISNKNIAKKLGDFSALGRSSSDSQENGVYNDLYGFSINLDFVKYVEKGDYHTYNFVITREAQIDDKLENLVLSLNDDGDYSAFILRYDFTAAEFQNFNLDSLKNRTATYTPIDLDISFLESEISVGNRVEEMTLCIEEWIYVPGTPHNGDLHGADCTCSGDSGNWVLSSSICGSSGGGVGDHDPYSGNNGSGNGSTPGGSEGSGSNPGGIVTAPNTIPYDSQMKNFESGVLDTSERSYYKSDSNIKNTVDWFLIGKNFSNTSLYDAKAILSFGNTLNLNFAQFNWAFDNRSSLDFIEIKDDLIEFSIESRTVSKMKIDANRAKTGWDFSKTGTFMNRPSLKYKAAFTPNPGENMYLLENGLMLYQSSTKRVINQNIEETIAETEVPTDGYNYIYNYDTKTWYEYRMPPRTYADADVDFLMTALWTGVKIAGRYATPIEDAIILIDGKDFDGVAQNKVQTAGFMIVGLVPGGKLTKVFKPITKVIKGSDIARNGWRTISKTGNKTITLSFKVVNGLVDFGSRSKLATVINTTTFEEAHHIIPWNKLDNEIIQEAAYAGFHMNSKVNGKALQKYTSLTGEGLHGNHPRYDEVVEHLINEFKKDTPNFASNQAKDFLETDLIPILTDWIERAKLTNLNLNEYFKQVVKPYYNIN